MDDFALLFLQASLACCLAGAMVWGGLALASRVFPALTQQRSVWLTGQIVIAASLLLALSPHSTQWRVLPAIAVEAAAPASTPAPLVAATSHVPVADELIDDGASWLNVAARLWLALYCGGVLVAALCHGHARRSLHGLLHGARRLDAAELAAHPAFAPFSAAQLAGLTVRETDAPVSPMLTGLWRPSLLLPCHLRSFSPAQQQLVVAHELTHWRRCDPWLVYASLLLRAVLWFHPALAALGRRLSWAQELSCDQQVLAGRSQQQRQQYAQALVQQLKLQQFGFGMGLAFGAHAADSLHARVSRIRAGAVYRHALLGKYAVMMLLFAVLGISLALQPAFALQAVGPEPVTVASVTAAGALPVWRLPVSRPRISSRFGVQRGAAGKAHRGMDFVMPSGTSVQAVADGKVIESTDLYAEGERYGKVVVLEHADHRRSLYAHLDQRQVRVGDTVKAGQPIGRSGKSGKVTGPHLHLEVLDNGRPIDPARMFPQ